MAIPVFEALSAKKGVRVGFLAAANAPQRRSDMMIIPNLRIVLVLFAGPS